MAITLAGVLLVGGLGSAAAQEGAETSGHARGEAKQGRGFDKTAAAPVEQARAAVPATPATPATRGGPDGPATPATPASPAESARPLAPPGLSEHAPDAAPNVGVIGGGPKTGGSSPAATPEPSTLLMMAAGLAGVYGLRRRRR